MKLLPLAGLAPALLSLSCLWGVTGLKEDPRWVKTLVSQLRCGQSLEEIRVLTDREVEKTTSQPDLGSFWINEKWADVWFELQDGRLVTVTTGRIDGYTSKRISSKRNLCTGELTFRISLGWVKSLEGADVYLDGQLLEANASSGVVFYVSGGDHELLVKKKGYEPIVRHLHLGPEDRGHQWMDLESDDLNPSSDQAGSPEAR